MFLTINDLAPLNDVKQQIKYIDVNQEVDRSDFIETFHILINEILTKEPRLYEYYDFEERLYDKIYNTFTACYGEEITLFEKFNVNDVLLEAIELYFCMHKPRSYSNTFFPIHADYDALEKHIEKNMKKKQPEQKTPEWYDYRHSMLTASSIWKALSGEGVRNNLIYKKCLPNDTGALRRVNINSAMHWGHKYEPLSVLLYEQNYDTKIAEVGCVKHDTISFIGASPDGINIKKGHPLYGRALEIKNPVSRKITGIPKFDYWVQMQIQMEVWNFEEVDFLETVFKEYESEEEFKNDGTFNNTNSGKKKGIIIVFSGNKPIYKYMPFNLTEEAGDKWIDDIIEKNTPQLTWIQNIYWFLDDISCVLVPRNREWFAEVLPIFKKTWDTIIEERKTGYEHRAPKKKKSKLVKNSVSIAVQTQTDFEVVEEKKENTLVALESKNNLESNKKIIWRVRTESFDQADAQFEQ